jgi:hypothetical protein
MDEIFKPVKGFFGYEISNLGRLKSYRRKKTRMHTPRKTNSGMAYQLMHKGKCVQVKASHLVAWHFLPNPYMSRTVKHKNGDKNDCRAENLEFFVTYFEKVIIKARLKT